MSEQTEETAPKKKLGLGRPGQLKIERTVDAGQIRQAFSHGRTKTVAVEKRRKRTFTQAADGAMTEVGTVQREAEEALKADVAALAEPAEKEEPGRAAARELTEGEKAARARALSGLKQVESDMEEARRIARQREEEEARAEAEAARQAEEERGREEREKEADAAAEPDAAQPEAREPEAPAAAGDARPRAAPAKPRPGAPPAPADEEGDGARARGPGRRAGRPPPRRLTPKRGEPRRRVGRLTIAQALEEEERMRSLASLRRLREREKRAQRKPDEPVAKVVREVVLPETLTVQELANRMAQRSADVVMALMKMGVMATATQSIDADTAELVVAEFGHKSKRVSDADVEIGLKGPEDAEADMAARPPVVTVMGHVDHGKTSLLDALRHTRVASGEAGGITQHIGAYQLRIDGGRRITFIDTPGHAAFTAMRARGANVTDIVVLVVAADDGVMPQTVEAIDHAKAAGAPIVVAVNKIDRPDADGEKVRNELLQHDLVVENFGGEVLSVDISATEGTNLDKLVETVLLQAEVLELKANSDRSAEGVVIESRVERGRGAVATLLVQRGTLAAGDIVVAGREWGRVRAMLDDSGTQVEEAGPAAPVEIMGIGGTPDAGDEFSVVANEARAREVTAFRARRDRERRVSASTRGSVEQILENMGKDGVKELPVIIKADMQGSVEAIQTGVEKLSTDEVAVRVLHSGVGGINESDVTLAKASRALVVGFNVRANPQALSLSRRDRVEISYYAVIYDVLDDIKAMLSGMLSPVAREHFLGNAEILQVFNISRLGRVAGCRVTEGLVRRGSRVRLLRDDVVIHEGTLATLRRFKDEVREVRDGLECGMGFENYQDLKERDVIECFDVEEVARTL